jgi:hypothetical protein
VRRVAVPVDAQALSTLTRIDYADAFLVDTDAAHGYPAEQWARLILQDAPVTARTQLVAGWTMLGLKLRNDQSDRSVLGWQMRASSPDFLLLGADSRIGMPAELLFKQTGDALLFCTFVHHDNHIARAVWAATEPAHVRVVRDLLEQADARLRGARRAGGES